MQGDYFVQSINRKEKAEEDLYFAKKDRELIERLHTEGSNDEQDDGSATNTDDNG